MWHLFAKDEVLGIASWDEESWGNNISLFEIMLSKIQIDFSIDGDKKTKDDFMHMLFLFQSLEWDHLNRATIVKKISDLEMTTRTTTLGWDMDIVSGDLAEIIALFKSN